MVKNKCFECGFESLGYCSVHRDADGSMTSIINRTEVCEMFILTPSDKEIEKAEKGE